MMGLLTLLFLIITTYVSITNNTEAFPLISGTFYTAEINLQDIQDDFNDHSIILRDISGKFNFHSKNNILNILGIFSSTLIISCGGLLLLILIRKFIYDVYINTPFSENNIKRLKLISLIFIVLPIVVYYLGLTYLHFYEYSEIVINQMIIKPRPINNIYQGFFIGGLIYTFAAAFEKGFQIKEEQELTV